MRRKVSGAEKLIEKLDRLSEPEKGAVLEYIKKATASAARKDENMKRYDARNS